jgi:hypothetical protein
LGGENVVIVKENPYKSIIVEDEDGNNVTISEGDKIQFCLESGLIKKGVVTKFQGKDDKLKIQMMPLKNDCEEIWSVLVMAEGSLKLDNEEGE